MKIDKNLRPPKHFLTIILLIFFENLFLFLLLSFFLFHRVILLNSFLFIPTVILVFFLIVFLTQYVLRYLIHNIWEINKKLNTTMRNLSLKMDTSNISYHDNMLFLLEHLHDIREKKFSAELSHKEAELTALQRQINPHFLYNTLDAIRGLAYTEGAAQSAEMIACLSGLFRYITHESGRVLTFKQELANVENYFYIQQFRFGNRFILIEEIDKKDSIIMDCPIPAFTLQPIIENAIYHGLKNIKSNGHVTIHTLRTQSHLLITISDNGCGIDFNTLKKINLSLHNIEHIPASTSEHSGIALSNVNARIQLNFGPEYGLTITSNPNQGTDVQILLPINN